MMSTLLRNTLTVLILMLGASLQAQTVIPVCPEKNKTLMFNRPAGIGNNDFEWYNLPGSLDDLSLSPTQPPGYWKNFLN